MEKILIVEDDKALSNGIALALKAEGYLFLQTYDLAEAREILDKEEISLVILDLNLPDGSGLTLLTEIKKKQETPVVILTANDRLYHQAFQSYGAARPHQYPDAENAPGRTAGISVGEILFFLLQYGIYQRKSEDRA